jgi:hypothetical protein
MAVCGFVYVLGDSAASDADFRRLFAAAAKSGTPTRDVYYFRNRPREATAAQYEAVPEGVPWWPFAFPVVPLSGRAAYLGVNCQASSRDWFVYRLDDRRDAKLLASISDLLAQEDSRTILDGTVMDGCRWCGAPCPAGELRRVVITAAGKVKPCLTGPVLGTLEDTPAELRARAAAAMVEAQRLRGCAACPVAGSCSKCLAPFPLGADEFCDLRRDHPAVAQVVTCTNLSHTYHPGDC